MKALHILIAILLLPLLSLGQQLGIGVSPSYVATHKAQDTSTPTPSGDALTMTTSPEALQTVNIYVEFVGSLTVDWGDGSEPEAMVNCGGGCEIANSHEYALSDDYDIVISGDVGALTGLYCSSNSLTYIDLTNCVALHNLFCGLNQLTEQAITSLIGTMVDRSELSNGYYVITPMTETFPQTLTEGQTSALTAKNWQDDS